jgi:hypothetical protein
MVVYCCHWSDYLFDDLTLLLIMIRILLFLFVGLLFLGEASAQCSMCRAVLESGDLQETAKGINNGIIYLMAIPYLLVAFVGYQIFKLIKK